MLGDNQVHRDVVGQGRQPAGQELEAEGQGDARGGVGRQQAVVVALAEADAVAPAVERHPRDHRQVPGRLGPNRTGGRRLAQPERSGNQPFQAVDLHCRQQGGAGDHHRDKHLSPGGQGALDQPVGLDLARLAADKQAGSLALPPERVPLQAQADALAQLALQLGRQDGAAFQQLAAQAQLGGQQRRLIGDGPVGHRTLAFRDRAVRCPGRPACRCSCC